MTYTKAKTLISSLCNGLLYSNTVKNFWSFFLSKSNHIPYNWEEKTKTPLTSLQSVSPKPKWDSKWAWRQQRISELRQAAFFVKQSFQILLLIFHILGFIFLKKSTTHFALNQPEFRSFHCCTGWDFRKKVWTRITEVFCALW